MAAATAAAATAATAAEPSGRFRRRAITGTIRRAKHRKLNRVPLPRALRAGNLLRLVQHNLLKVRLAILANVFVDRHNFGTKNSSLDYSKANGRNQAIISTIKQSKSIARTVNAAMIRVPFRPNSASRIKKGEHRITNLVNDRHRATHDQSPKSTLHGIVRNAAIHAATRVDTESNADQARIGPHLGCDCAPSWSSSPFHATKRRHGGENRETTPMTLNRNVAMGHNSNKFSKMQSPKSKRLPVLVGEPLEYRGVGQDA